MELIGEQGCLSSCPQRQLAAGARVGRAGGVLGSVPYHASEVGTSVGVDLAGWCLELGVLSCSATVLVFFAKLLTIRPILFR